MWHQAQRGPGHSKPGYTLIEMIVAVAMVLAVLAVVMGGYKVRIAHAKLVRTVNDMTALAQASLDFYNSQGSWPPSPSHLVPVYMYAAVNVSPFGGSYQIAGLNRAVMVSADVPSGLAENFYGGTLLTIMPGIPNDVVSITQHLANEFSGRLEYEKKYVYRQ